MAAHLGGIFAQWYERNFPLPPVQTQADKMRLGPPPKRKPGIFVKAFCGILFGVVPLLVAYVAAFVAYISTTPIPMGTLFWMLGQPGLLFVNKTAAVPANLEILPRPANELFLDLPGGSKMPMSGLGMCCRPTAYHDESVRRSVLWFLLQGGRHIDTAAVYLNHKAVGLAIKDAVARGIPRSEIFVTTKIWSSHFNEKLATEWVQEMLQELGLDYVDLVLMHTPRRNAGIWPGLLPQWSKMLPFWDESVKGLVWIGGLAAIWPNDEDEDFKDLGCDTIKQCRQQTWKALSGARDNGLIKEVGVSNFRPRHLRELQSMKLAPIAVNQIMYHPWNSPWWQETVEYCREHKIAVTGHTTLGGAMLTSKTFAADLVREIASKHARSPAAVLQRWAIQNKVSVIPGSGNPEHMKDNLDVFSFELSADEMARIDALRNASTAKPTLDIPEWLNN